MADEKTLWDDLKPKMIDAGIIGAGVGTGVGIGAVTRHLIKNDTRVGQLWDRLPPATRLKVLIPVTAGLGATTAALSALRDTYRHREPQKPMRVIITEDRTKTAFFGGSIAGAVTGGSYGAGGAYRNSNEKDTNLKTIAGAVGGIAAGVAANKYLSPRIQKGVDSLASKIRNSDARWVASNFGGPMLGTVATAGAGHLAGRGTNLLIDKIKGNDTEKTASLEEFARSLARQDFCMEKMAEEVKKPPADKQILYGALGAGAGLLAGRFIGQHLSRSARRLGWMADDAARPLYMTGQGEVLNNIRPANQEALLAEAKKHFDKARQIQGASIATGTGLGGLSGYYMANRDYWNDQRAKAKESK